MTSDSTNEVAYKALRLSRRLVEWLESVSEGILLLDGRRTDLAGAWVWSSEGINDSASGSWACSGRGDRRNTRSALLPDAIEERIDETEDLDRDTDS